MAIVHAIGWLLCGAAALLAGLEAAAHADPRIQGVLVPAADLWAVVAPQSFAAFRGALPPGLWADVLSLPFAAPAWVLAGAPGLLAVLLGHPPHDEETESLEHALGLYDRLAREARDGVHDVVPSDESDDGGGKGG